MDFLKSKHAWLAAPLLWLAGVSALVLVWALATPEWIQAHFDHDGASPVEVATVGLFFFQMGFFWLVPPMRASRLRPLWLADFSLLTFFAICRELDWHKLLISASNLPGATRGTPFKMKFLTNANNPLADRLIVAACFAVVILLCAGTLLYFLRRLLTGLFKLHPVCWSMGFFGGTIILIQITDRLPAVLRKDLGIRISESLHALMTALEEGQELLLPLFVVIAVLQAHFIYNNEHTDSAPLDRFRGL
ncbi:MAG TPA: hypothetical protein PL176_13795 [Kiritimatiellia bacterium]|nr:MAG: hypothetical protein BWX70_00007 [Verrucomicrobia bacterium ADurb.Bin070]HPB11133.1 hypothetical protein [Kiritimatiellia bacterium]HPO39077.1 hypothetical protein [Kiritimatiellia bacterium]